MFTDDEIELIEEGLDALMAKRPTEILQKSLIGMMLSTSKEEAQTRSDEALAELKADEVEHKSLERRIVLLKAKLYQLENVSIANDAKKFMEEDK